MYGPLCGRLCRARCYPTVHTILLRRGDSTATLFRANGLLKQRGYASSASAKGRAGIQSAAATLGIDPTGLCSKTELKAAFRQRAIDTHPDRAAARSADSDSADDEFKAVQAAYELLLTEVSRREELQARRVTAEVNEDPLEQGRRAKETWDDFNRNAAQHYERFRRATVESDSETSARDAAAAAAAMAGFEPSTWDIALAEGWREQGSVTGRADKGTGFKLVRTIDIKVTAPDGSSGTGSWEEWTGQYNANRRRSLVTMPSRFALARKVFGNEAFESRLEEREARAEFGKWAVNMARARKMFQR